MPFTPGPNQYRCVIDYSIYGESASNSVWLFDTTGAAATRAPEAATLVANWVENELMPLLSDDLTCNGVTAYAMDSVTAPKASVLFSPTVAGGVTSPVEGLQVTALLSLGTGGRGRSARGRLYIPGIPASSITDGLITPAARTQLEAAALVLRNDAAAGSFEWIVSSAQTAGVPLTARSKRAVTTFAAKAPTGTQRRRVRSF